MTEIMLATANSFRFAALLRFVSFAHNYVLNLHRKKLVESVLKKLSVAVRVRWRLVGHRWTLKGLR